MHYNLIDPVTFIGTFISNSNRNVPIIFGYESFRDVDRYGIPIIPLFDLRKHTPVLLPPETQLLTLWLMER